MSLLHLFVGVKYWRASIANTSPTYGLNSDQLTVWFRQLGIPVSGSIQERVERVIAHFDQLRPRMVAEADEREVWFDFYEELARRDHVSLRAQHGIENSLEINLGSVGPLDRVYLVSKVGRDLGVNETTVRRFRKTYWREPAVLSELVLFEMVGTPKNDEFRCLVCGDRVLGRSEVEEHIIEHFVGDRRPPAS